MNLHSHTPVTRSALLAVGLLILFCLTIPSAALAAETDTQTDGGILEAIWNFFFWWLPAAEEAPDGDAVETQPEPTIPGTEITSGGEEAPVEGETATTPPRTLGTVYAVDYRTVPPYGSAPMMVRFTAIQAEDIESYAWDFGDGYTSTERDHWHTYPRAGTYTATLTVGNSAGWSQTAEIAIRVEPPGVVPLPESEEWL
jgi:chitodextrinase